MITLVPWKNSVLECASGLPDSGGAAAISGSAAEISGGADDPPAVAVCRFYGIKGHGAWRSVPCWAVPAAGTARCSATRLCRTSCGVSAKWDGCVVQVCRYAGTATPPSPKRLPPEGRQTPGGTGACRHPWHHTQGPRNKEMHGKDRYRGGRHHSGLPWGPCRRSCCHPHTHGSITHTT